MTLSIVFLSLIPSSWAGASGASFSTNAGDWVGGTVADGVLRVTDGSATLTTGPVDSFTLDARIRLTDGGSITTRAGEAALTAAWGAGGGLELAVRRGFSGLRITASSAIRTALPVKMGIVMGV